LITPAGSYEVIEGALKMALLEGFVLMHEPPPAGSTMQRTTSPHDRRLTAVGTDNPDPETHSTGPPKISTSTSPTHR